MNLRIYRDYGALNSAPIFDAFTKGAIRAGFNIVNSNEDIAVIWSVLWQGRMAKNKEVYYQMLEKNKPVIIVEVGNLKRGITWRISVGNINGNGLFNNLDNLDMLRPTKLQVALQDPKLVRQPEILIATQHQSSLQWQGQPSMEDWVIDTIKEIKQYTDRKIIVRPHPRSPFKKEIVNAIIEIPKKISGSYDDFNINYNYHSVVNFNSGPAVQSAIQGVPIVCDSSSLASPVSDILSNIETPILPDRTDWFLKLCHTEWTVDEIMKGTPLDRIKKIL